MRLMTWRALCISPYRRVAWAVPELVNAGRLSSRLGAFAVRAHSVIWSGSSGGSRGGVSGGGSSSVSSPPSIHGRLPAGAADAATWQGLVHFSAQPEPYLSLNPHDVRKVSHEKRSHQAEKWTSVSGRV
jgi:hypothetical protein